MTPVCPTCGESPAMGRVCSNAFHVIDRSSRAPLQTSDALQKLLEYRRKQGWLPPEQEKKP